MIILEFPRLEHKEMYEEMYEEWMADIDGLRHPMGLFEYEDRDFHKFVERIHLDLVGREGLVPATMYFLLDTERKKMLGGISIRHHINHPNLVYRGGHIGYGVRPNERKKGYATQMLQLGLIEAKKIGIDKVLITCNSGNIASAKVIEKNGGKLESQQLDKKGEAFNRYWIEL